jgi:hypothetical protein
LIRFFPHLKEEELLYSACARWRELFRYPGERAVATALFGSKERTAILDLPTGRESLVGNLPCGHGYTVDGLIQDHTTFPYHAHFVGPERVAAILDRMRHGGIGAAVPTMLGVGTGRVPPPNYVLFCPACAHEDVERCGEALWRRVHQVPGVFLCPDHGLPLRRKNLVGVFAYQALGEWLRPDAPEDEVPGGPQGRLRWLAEQSLWLLRAAPRWLAPEQLVKRHRARLREIGMFTAHGRLRAARVTEALRAHWGTQLLVRMELDRSPAPKSLRWVLRQAGDNHHRTAGAPLRHLLLIGLYGITAEQFLDDEPSVVAPVSRDGAARECANPVCPDYQPPGDRHVARRAYLARGVSHDCGTCGCEYTEHSRAQHVRFLVTGTLWDQALLDAALEGVGPAELGRRLGVSPQRALCHADRLGIWREEWGERERASWEVHERSARELTEQKRAEWLRARSEQPEAHRSQLMRCNVALHSWLRSNDNAWLVANRPAVVGRVVEGQRTGVDWPRRDRDLKTRVEDAVRRLLDPGAPPVRITRASIGRAIGAQVLIMSRDERLPYTNSAVEAAVETVEDFVRRRIRWHAQQCISRRETVVFTDFLERCGIEWSKRHLWQVALDGALESIQGALALGPRMPRRAAEELAD